MCTSLIVPTAPGGPVVSARTMDFDQDLEADLRLVPLGHPVPGAPDWETTQGFVGVAVMVGPIPVFVDGMNDAGLSAAALWLPGTALPAAPPDTPTIILSSLVAWILGRFDAAGQVQEALGTIAVVGLDGILPLHVMVVDAAGDTLVIEFVDGVMQVTTGQPVLTNAPPLPWHLDNLPNYENLSVVNAPNDVFGQELNGSGLRGLPGDGTPPSRFVRAALLRRGVFQPADAQDAVGLALQLLGACAVPKGTIASAADPTETGDYTQWSVVRDHTDRCLYISTSDNAVPQRVALGDLSFEGTEVLSAPVEQPAWYADITGQLAPSG